MMTTKETIIRKFDALADKRQYWINRNRYYYDEQKKHFRFLVPEGLSILELGCGTGDLLNSLKPKHGVGIDFSAKMLNIAKKKYPHLEFRLADIDQING